MNLKDQVLSINQVQELQELGFDVSKYATLYWASCDGCSSANCFERQILELNISKSKCCVNQTNIIPTLTIGDIMDILPKVINSHGIEYGRNADYGLSLIYLNKYYIRYIGIHISLALIIFESYNLIDVLFEALKWCIQNKHIEL